jgi:cyanophycin synthetase
MSTDLSADPYTEIRLTGLGATRGANFWSRRPVTRLDLVVGVFENVSSADVPGFTDRLVAAMAGLAEHRCSVGEAGGFVARLHRGTYAPHVVEHVALELQAMLGHDVGYGRARGGDAPGAYTVVFEHRHEDVGLRAGALALEVVQQAFAGTLTSVAHAVAELAAIAEGPAAPRATARVLCAVTGGAGRAALRAEVARRACCADALVVDVSPGYVLQAGLPYAESQIAVVLDADLADVPARYRDPERARRLVSVAADALPRGRVLVAPAKEWEVQDYARDRGCGVAVFSARDDVTRRDRKVARSAAWVAGDEVVIEHRGRPAAAEARRDDLPPGLHAAAALVAFTLGDAASR